MNNKRGPKEGSKFKEAHSHKFGKKLFEVRKRKGLTQTELGKKIGASTRAISHYEREMPNPSMNLLEQLAEALEVPVKVFLDDKAIEKIEETPNVIRSLKMLLPKLAELPRKKQEHLVFTINTLLKN